MQSDEHTRATVNVTFGRGEPARDKVAEEERAAELAQRDIKPEKMSLGQRIARWWDRQIGVDHGQD